MKILALLALLASQSQAAYFDSFFAHPSHPQVGARVLFDTKVVARGAMTDLALFYHRANDQDSIIPQSWRDAGIKPISWSLLDLGIGKQSGEFILAAGPSMNLSPAILGPICSRLKASENATLRALGNVLDSSNGKGIAFGPKWYATPIRDTTVLPLNQWDFRPGFTLGATWAF
jgi:hypothetical protein